MGIGLPCIDLLVRESSRRPFKGRLLTLGRQDIIFSDKTLRAIANKYRIVLSCPEEITLAQKPGLAAQDCISDDYLFRSLGFSDYLSLDVSDYEGAHIIFDLNSKELPEQVIEAFDVIIDGGTIEHIYHVPNVLNNIYRMLRQNGRVIHFSPTSNYVDHGFYMFSPTLFWDFYHTNQFEITDLIICKLTPFAPGPYSFLDYVPGSMNHVSRGGLDNSMYLTVCIATKTENSTGDKIPQQGSFIESWITENKTIDQTHYEHILQLLEKGKSDIAKRLSYLAASNFRSNPYAWLAYGRVLQETNQLSNALQAYKQSLQLEITPDALSQLSKIYVALGKYSEASKVANSIQEKFTGWCERGQQPGYSHNRI